MIPEQLLREHGGTIRGYNKRDFIFKEGNRIHRYHQIVSGKIKFSAISRDGKEVIHNIFEDGESFGEAFLFIEEDCPLNAIALTDCKIITLPRKSFLNLLKEYPAYSLEVNKLFSQRLFYKMRLSQHLVSNRPEERIKALMDYLKYSKMQEIEESLFLLPLTRQQMADFTGLTVETVIRTVKNLEKEGSLEIIDRKIFY